MPRDFSPVEWDATTIDDCRQLIRLGVREDLRNGFDWTTVSLVDESRRGRAAFVAREDGVACGLQAAALAIEETGSDLLFDSEIADGDRVVAQQTLATVSGQARDILTIERLMLNLLGRLSGVATKTASYVQEIEGTNAHVYDTRKTTPGWRRLEKYAVRCGGGRNHRCGLNDAVLIKDNHLALSRQANLTPAESVLVVRKFLEGWQRPASPLADMLIEIEVDKLEQLKNVLAVAPDIVLLDNMSPDLLQQAVALREQLSPETQLEASGGITHQTIRVVAETGVERISVGGLTHSAVNFDIGLDWLME